jgi:hypothetical protein
MKIQLKNSDIDLTIETYYGKEKARRRRVAERNDIKIDCVALLMLALRVYPPKNPCN